MNKLVRDALWPVLVAAWIVGLIHQIGSWSMMAVYVAISLVMTTVRFADRRVLNFARRRNRRR